MCPTPKHARPRTISEQYPGMRNAHCHVTFGITPRDWPSATLCRSCAERMPQTIGTLIITLSHGFVEGQREWTHCNGCGMNMSVVRPVTDCPMCHTAYTNIIPILRNEGVDITEIYSLVFCHETQGIVELRTWQSTASPINHTLLD